MCGTKTMSTICLRKLENILSRVTIKLKKNKLCENGKKTINEEYCVKFAYIIRKLLNINQF